VKDGGEIIIPLREDGRLDMQRVVAYYDAPAYVRRAREVEGALEALLQRCRQQRDRWLELATLRLGQLHALASSWDRLRPWLADDEQVDLLAHLEAELSPRLRCPVSRTSLDRVLWRALRQLCASIERFNQRWQAFVPTVDVAVVNELRAGYNRYYVFEKECAVRSARLARQGFVPLPPLTAEDIVAHLPLLTVPRLAAGDA
jgi:hypothetical protein